MIKLCGDSLIYPVICWTARTAEGNFKKQFYNHRKSFNNETSGNNTTVSKYTWELKKHQIKTHP